MTVKLEQNLIKITFKSITDDLNPLVHNSITEYEQNVSLTLKCETVANQIHGLISTSIGGTKIE